MRICSPSSNETEASTSPTLRCRKNFFAESLAQPERGKHVDFTARIELNSSEAEVMELADMLG